MHEFGHAPKATFHLNRRGIRIFEFSEFAKGMRDGIRANAERVAAAAGLTIGFLRSAEVNKEAHVQEILAERGTHPGLVCVLSVMETCATYKPWHNKEMHKDLLDAGQRQVPHYYFYFIDEALGLCYLPVPTWAPYRLQFYSDGHLN